MQFYTIKYSSVVLTLISALSLTTINAASQNTRHSPTLNATTSLFDNAFIKNLEISASGGTNWVQSSGTHPMISPLKTDNNLVSTSSNDGSWKVGLGYYLFDEQLSTRQVINHLLFEINVYNLATTLNGNVWRNQTSPLSNYLFSATLSSSRLMFDFKPTLFTAKKFSPYLIFGVGPTWNTMSYSQAAIGAGIDPASALQLGNNTTTQVAWDLGAGLNIALTDRLNATVEYVYAFLGNGSPANITNLSSSPHFSFQTQSLLLGLSLKL